MGEGELPIPRPTWKPTGGVRLTGGVLTMGGDKIGGDKIGGLATTGGEGAATGVAFLNSLSLAS